MEQLNWLRAQLLTLSLITPSHQKMRPNLTDTQLAAIGSQAARTFVEAGPGAGKTTIAAERFGLARFGSYADARRGVVAVSFTVAASRELRQRVTQRWGPDVIAGRSRVRTIDAELTDILCLLLRRGAIKWPGGLTEIEPVDSADNHPSWTYNAKPDQWASWTPALSATEVKPEKVYGQRMKINKKPLEKLLADGFCTHADVRRILAAAFADPEIRAVVVQHRKASVSHFLVDEVFDADDLDLDLIRLHCEAEIPVTVAGDQWQALYEFREAKPLVVEQALEEGGELGFSRVEVLESHRFVTGMLAAMATNLRGAPCVLPAVDDESLVEVVIAPWWRNLWYGPAWVLPYSFGRIYDQTDAMFALLLDHLLQREFGGAARSRGEALMRLRLDPDTTESWPEELGSILDLLVDSSEAVAIDALEALRRIAPQVGAHQTVSRRPKAVFEAAATRQMRLLAARAGHAGPFVPGISAHQAKGRQWKHVGICVPDDDVAAIAVGLVRNEARHRALYVAMTRGSHSMGRLVDDPLA